MQNYELDKIMLAIALGMFVIIFSCNIGNMLYYTPQKIKKRGYIIQNKKKTIINNNKSNKSEIKQLKEKNIIELINSADTKIGENIFKICNICHNINKNQQDKIGPNLQNIINSKVARSTNFNYSKGMQKLRKNGTTWTYKNLYNFLYSPKQYIPDTKMKFEGIKNNKERASLIKFLKLKQNKINKQKLK